MKLLLKAQRERLLANGATRPDNPTPVVKFFAPWSNATWLIVEKDPEDNDTLFGLCDLGMGFPELGNVRLSEMQAARGPSGLRIERDMYFVPNKALSEYADQARAAGGIVA